MFICMSPPHLARLYLASVHAPERTKRLVLGVRNLAVTYSHILLSQAWTMQARDDAAKSHNRKVHCILASKMKH